jgi:hypothetical protein
MMLAKGHVRDVRGVLGFSIGLKFSCGRSGRVKLGINRKALGRRGHGLWLAGEVLAGIGRLPEGALDNIGSADHIRP